MSTDDLFINRKSEELSPDFLSEALGSLISEMLWEIHDFDRIETFFNRQGTPYQYGKERGFRPLKQQPEPRILKFLWSWVELATDTEYEACFINLYTTGRGYIGWHSDDSPSIDQTRPISILSLGAPRLLKFRRHDNHDIEWDTLSNHGSIVVMKPGIQSILQHSVDPVKETVGSRISLVFRGLLPFEGQLKKDFEKYGISLKYRTTKADGSSYI